ncbi:MAG: DUF1588 domain-containing protein [Bdellovibrio sp.]|nr:DUF1588 domain-containing protein [Bdellovibrio sp.]
MKHLIVSLFLITSTLSFSADAQEIPPAVFLNKITQRLIGSWPMPADYELLQKEMKSSSCNAVSCMDKFFRNYIRDKMKRAEFYALFYAEVTERFGYKSPPSSMIGQIISSGQISHDPSASRDFALVYRTLKENQSFDELFTSQLLAYPSHKDTNVNDVPIDLAKIDSSKTRGYGAQTSSYTIQDENGQGFTAAVYDFNDHANISGLFSTRRFLTRYWNTPLNKNRKRSAAFFRIMLCDSMSPALERETQRSKELRMAMGKSDEQIITDEIRSVHNNKHGTQKDCAACHTRLDPVGFTMNALEVGISGESFKGNLRFFNSSNQMSDIPVKNFHDLTVKATTVPKYLDCQTNWLIEAFLGKDLNLPPQRFAEVVNEVEKKKRRLKDVIEDLLMVPEFRGLKTKVAEPASLIAAKTVLSNCSECHSNTFSLRPEQMKSRLSRVAVCLDLPNNGKEAQMPPSDHYWTPNANELASIKGWLQEGAPLGGNTKLFEKNEVDQMLAPNKDVKKCRQ